jgi:hypothetical protein
MEPLALEPIMLEPAVVADVPKRGKGKGKRAQKVAEAQPQGEQQPTEDGEVTQEEQLPAITNKSSASKVCPQS